jgi:hypothetical protein
MPLTVAGKPRTNSHVLQKSLSGILTFEVRNGNGLHHDGPT